MPTTKNPTIAELLDIHSLKECSSFYTKVHLKDNGPLLWLVFRTTLFFPIYFRMWCTRISWIRFIFISLLYIVHVLLLILYWTNVLKFGCHCSSSSWAPSSHRLFWDLHLPLFILVLYSFAQARRVAASAVSTSEWASAAPAVVSSPTTTTTTTTTPSSGGSFSAAPSARSTFSPRRVASSPSYPNSDSEDSEDDMDTNLTEDVDIVTEEETFIEQSMSAMKVNVCVFSDKGVGSKIAMSLNELRRCLVNKSEAMPQQRLYRHGAVISGILTAVVPLIYTLFVLYFELTDSQVESLQSRMHCSMTFLRYQMTFGQWISTESQQGTIGPFPSMASLSWHLWNVFLSLHDFINTLLLAVWNNHKDELVCVVVAISSTVAQMIITMRLFRYLADAEITLARRYQYARCFKCLTSSRGAAKLGLPCFSLKNVVNIKFWLILRAGRGWLSRQKHQREADAIAAFTFALTIFLAAIMIILVFVNNASTVLISPYNLYGNSTANSPEWPCELGATPTSDAASSGDEMFNRFPMTLLHWEVLVWFLCTSLYLLRFMMLGTRINSKYNDTTVLLTEQINVHLRILQSANSKTAREKRESLQVALNVLKLSTKLLKELGSPNRISGLAMNRMLYNVTRVVLLSALSSALSGPLGFNLRLWTLAKLK